MLRRRGFLISAGLAVLGSVTLPRSPLLLDTAVANAQAKSPAPTRSMPLRIYGYNTVGEIPPGMLTNAASIQLIGTVGPRTALPIPVKLISANKKVAAAAPVASDVTGPHGLTGTTVLANIPLPEGPATKIVVTGVRVSDARLVVVPR